jgi:hypothetical protein
MKLLEAVEYNFHQWNICGDWKVTGKLMGMQGGFMKFCCLLCLWDSYSAAEHYIKHDWEPRKTYEPAKGSV